MAPTKCWFFKIKFNYKNKFGFQINGLNVKKKGPNNLT